MTKRNCFNYLVS